MITLLLILLKFSLTIMVLWVFYKLLLEKLTFFVSNRFFFLGSIFIAFFIAISRFDWADDLFRNQINNTNMGQYVTVTNQPFSKPIVQWLPLLGRILLFVYCMGVIVLGFHLAIQFLSYLKLKRSAHLKEMYGLKVHVVAQDIYHSRLVNLYLFRKVPLRILKSGKFFCMNLFIFSKIIV